VGTALFPLILNLLKDEPGKGRFKANSKARPAGFKIADSSFNKFRMSGKGTVQVKR